MNLSRNIEIKPSTASRVAGGITTGFFCPTNTADAEGVMFMWIGSSFTLLKTTGACFHLQGSSYSTAGWTNIGSTVLIQNSLATGWKQTTVVVDCYKPKRKFVRLAVHHTTGDQTVTAIKYGLRRGGSTEALCSTSGLAAFALSVSAT